MPASGRKQAFAPMSAMGRKRTLVQIGLDSRTLPRRPRDPLALAAAGEVEAVAAVAAVGPEIEA